MDAKNMLVGLLLIATFPLPSLATFERDAITPEAIQAILDQKKTNPNSNYMLSDLEDAVNALTGKIVIADNLVLEEALRMMRSNNVKLDGIHCAETCFWGKCHTAIIGCSCENKICYKNSLLAN